MMRINALKRTIGSIVITILFCVSCSNGITDGETEWTYVASSDKPIKMKFFYDKASIHYPYKKTYLGFLEIRDKDYVRVWTKTEHLTLMYVHNSPANIKYITDLVEIEVLS